MIRISGQPGNFKTSETIEISWEDCMVKCRADVNCVIPTQVQCPTSNPLIPGPNYYTQLINSQFHKTTVSPDSLSNNIYNLTYSIATCPKNTKLFQRGETTVVCIGLYFFESPLCNNQAEASALCKAQNGTLTGPANDDEYEYIQDVSNSSKYTSNPDSTQWLTYWLDGVGTNTAYEYTFEDPTHNGSTNYKWTPGSPHLTGPGICSYNPGPYNANVQIATQVQCPTSNPLIPGPTYYTQLINSQFHKTTVSPDTLSNNLYNLTYSIATCPNNTKMFQRGETTVVCIGLYFFEEPLCNTHAEASALCKAQSGTLTAPANADEYEYIQDISNSSKYTSNPASYKWLTYWIDGVSTNTAYVYTFEDTTLAENTTFQWTPGSPHLQGAGNCLHNPGPFNSNVQTIELVWYTGFTKIFLKSSDVLHLTVVTPFAGEERCVKFHR
ncbi:hypothetical protein B9Z55_007330 [Caenorhabditis nigoni]|uniref:C-type lectin domain-containing protein n=2 Tax=Caenorhabditis nigoni TaxID=1611254 RepID=A0A2G5V933_9PELO|nr:hypothetical protein B9Z55_007330 [Caenorhabditis nigoni]